MAKVTIEIPDILLDDFVKAAKDIQFKYFKLGVTENDNQKKNKHLEKFSATFDIISVLEDGIVKRTN